MDATMEDDCRIEGVVPGKKKKMKQARLPFQMLSTADKPNSPLNKKRKLTSPSIDCKSPKVVKMTTKENSIENKNKQGGVKDNKNSMSDNADNIGITEVAHVNGTNEKVTDEVDSTKTTPKRHLIIKGKKGEKKTPLSSSSLTKFLKHSKESENDEDQSSTDSKKSKEKFTKASNQGESLNSTIKQMDSTKSKETVPGPVHRSDSDIEILSSDNESNEEQQLVNTNEQETVHVESPKTPKHDKHSNTKRKKLKPKQLNKKLKPIRKTAKQSKILKNSEDNEKSTSKTKKIEEVSVKSSDNQESPEPPGTSIDTEMECEDMVTESAGKSDSDIEILSSDNDDKEEEQITNAEEEESVNDASPKTPKTPKTPKHDKSFDNKLKKLTPKQQEKRLESARKKEEREKMRMEKDKKLEEERENKRREREEKKREKEEKEQMEKEQKLKEKEQKQLKKLMEIEQKQKEKEVKEEERRKKEEAREEERKRKEEEKLEAERKKQKAASTFASFFVPKKHDSKPIEDDDIIQAKNFMPFEVKADMKVAPVARRMLSDDEKCVLDEKLQSTNLQKSKLYLTEIKKKQTVPRTCGKTWPFEFKDDVIVIDEDNEVECNVVEQPVPVEKHRAKLLQFSENRRPPFWGTWRKRSSSIKPRRPFSTDSKWFNYEVDSDEEWEEEEEGESLRGSDDEKDEENPESNEYDVDNEFMVPHGYLSDEEVRADEEDKEDMSPETQKFKLKVLGDQFECERNEKTLKLKPKIIGCIWQGPSGKFSENITPRMVDFLSARRAWVFQNPVLLPTEQQSVASGENSTPTKASTTTTSRKTKVPKEALPDLIRLVHGNIHGKGFLVKEFIAYWHKKHEVGENLLSKASLAQKIRDVGKWMACPEEGVMHLKACWYVPEKIRALYLPEDEQLTLPNRWPYILTPKRRREVLEPDKTDKEDKVKEKDKEMSKEKDKEKKTVPLITQFTKKITQEEMKKQLATSSSSTSSAKSSQQKAPKRATLVSIGRGEQFSKTTRDNLLKTFLDSDKSGDTSKNAQNGANSDDDVQLIELDKPITMNVDVTEQTKDNRNKLDTIQPVGNKGNKRSDSFSGDDESREKTTDVEIKSTESSNGTSEAPMDVDEIELDD